MRRDKMGGAMNGFDAMIWTGAAVTLLGVAGLLACVVWVVRLRRSALPEDLMRRMLQRAVVYNMGALFSATLGLMLVVIGIALK
jgi:heme exporter protein D